MVTGANAVEVHEKIRRLERAHAGFEHSRYPGYPKFYTAVELAANLNEPARTRSLDEAALGYFKQAFTDGSFQPGDEPEILEVLANGWANRFFARNSAAVCQIVQQAKGFSWLALALEGDYEVAEAWRVRGGGYANSVTSQGWQGFSDHLAKARVALSKAWEHHPERPYPAAEMIAVAMGASDADEMRKWFDRAIQAQIDYPQAWSNMRWGLRPRWHGSHEAMLALGIRAVDTKRFDTDVPRKFFDFISDVESEMDLEPGEHIYGRPDIWPHLQEMYEGYLAEPSQAAWNAGWRSTYTAVAALADHYEIARQQLEALEWNPARASFTGWGTDLSLLPLKVATLTGKAAEQAHVAESRYGQQDVADATKIFKEISSSPEADERTKQFSQCRLAALQQEAALAKGEWIELLPSDEKDMNWELGADKVRRLPDGGIEVEAGARGHGLYSRTRVGAEFEVTGEFELVRSSTKDFQAGLLMGLPDGERSEWYAFRMKRNLVEGEVASFSYGWGTREVKRKCALNEGTNTFQFRLQRDKADAWVNGVQVLRQASPVKTLKLSKDSFLGLGAYNDMNETVIRYRNVKARRLIPGQ
jgi:hypothetical protein